MRPVAAELGDHGGAELSRVTSKAGLKTSASGGVSVMPANVLSSSGELSSIAISAPVASDLLIVEEGATTTSGTLWCCAAMARP